MRLLTLNSTNLLPRSTKNKFVLEFPSSRTFVKGDFIALKKIGMFNSVFSIMAQYGNNQYTYTFPVGAGFATRNVLIPNGTYTSQELNAHLQSVMITNGDYLIDDLGQYVYFVQILANETFYAIELDLAPVPIALPALWTNGGIVFPPAPTTPQVTILNNNFTKIVGINPGTYPTIPQGTSFNKLSDFVPQLSSIFGSIVTCNLINNRLANPTSSLLAFPFNKPYGDLLDVDTKRLIFNPIVPGVYTSLEISFLDNDKKALEIVDDNLIIQCVLYLKSEDGDVATYYDNFTK